MKVILLNAPGGSHYEGPMMGIPSLTGQLRARGYPDAVQRDLDLELFYHTLKPGTLEGVCRIIREGAKRGDARAGLVKRLIARLFGPLALKRLASRTLREKEFLESFRQSTPLDRQFPERGLVRYKKGVNRVLKLMAIYYYPYLSYPRFFSLWEKNLFYSFHLKIGNTLSDCFHHGGRAFAAFYEDEVLPHLREEDYDVIGISVSFKRQLEPALRLAEIIKSSDLKAKIVLGGSYVTTILDADWFENTLMEYADYVVSYEGEEAFKLLLDRLKNNESLEDVPNLIHTCNGKVERNKKSSIFEMDSLEEPDYGGLPLDLYLERPVRLPLMTCRGCYWGRCTYCSHHWTLGSGRLRTLNPDRLFEIIKSFRRKYGVRSVYFTDESIHPATMDALADRIIESKTDFRWVGMLRFDECVTYDFLDKMRRSGCHAIMFGLESVSEHVQQIINKGIELERAHQVLRHCRELGIKVHIFIILGIPGEREVDMEANLAFLRKETHLYETVQLAPFQLMKGSPMYRHPEKFGIHGIETLSHRGQKAYSELKFETSQGLSRRQVNQYVSRIELDKALFRKDLWEGFGYRLYREDEEPARP